jgi:hypothetical protein
VHKRLQYPSNAACFRLQPNIITGVTTTTFTNYNYSYSVDSVLYLSGFCLHLSNLHCVHCLVLFPTFCFMSHYFPLHVLFRHLSSSLHLFCHYFYCPFTLLFIFIYVQTNSGPNVFDFIRSYSLYSNPRRVFL